MDIVLIIIAILLMLVGIAGCILPIIPGPPISFVALLVYSFTSAHPFNARFLAVAALLAVAVTVLDYVVPVWGTKKFGGSKKGVRGSTIGLILGLFAGPVGIIVGPFIGAVVGEMIDGKELQQAVRSGFGAFLGFVTGVIMKLGVSGWMAWHLAKSII